MRNKPITFRYIGKHTTGLVQVALRTNIINKTFGLQVFKGVSSELWLHRSLSGPGLVRSEVGCSFLLPLPFALQGLHGEGVGGFG